MISPIDTSFTMFSDTPASKDPDTYSRTLRDNHLLLWNKDLPNGEEFTLIANDKPPYYLNHKSDLGEFTLSSDGIIHTYIRWKRESMASIIRTIPQCENDSFYDLASTIGGYILFPANRIDGKPTINGIRGIHSHIMDRFDLTLECIHRWYEGVESPLYEHIERYSHFFRLFSNFEGYYTFFLLHDLVDNDTGRIRFWLPFDDFGITSPLPSNLDDYLEYRENASSFVRRRNLRIERFMSEFFEES